MDGQNGEKGVLDILRSNNILPYDAKAVEKYKQSMLNPALPLFRIKDDDMVGGIAILGSILVAVCGIIGAILLAVGCLKTGGVFGVIFLAGGAFEALVGIPNLRGTREWNSRPLSGYPRPVPEFAVATALETKRVLQEHDLLCEFYVEELTVKKRQFDPILVVNVYDHLRSNKGSFYLEIWDEPKFHKTINRD
jgi:hypothetical protein